MPTHFLIPNIIIDIFYPLFLTHFHIPNIIINIQRCQLIFTFLNNNLYPAFLTHFHIPNIIINIQRCQLIFTFLNNNLYPALPTHFHIPNLKQGKYSVAKSKICLFCIGSLLHFLHQFFTSILCCSLYRYCSSKYYDSRKSCQLVNLNLLANLNYNLSFFYLKLSFMHSSPEFSSTPLYILNKNN